MWGGGGVGVRRYGGLRGGVGGGFPPGWVVLMSEGVGPLFSDPRGF